jgi:hypothetical protein
VLDPSGVETMILSDVIGGLNHAARGASNIVLSCGRRAHGCIMHDIRRKLSLSGEVIKSKHTK